jgi:hypothetical protein
MSRPLKTIAAGLLSACLLALTEQAMGEASATQALARYQEQLKTLRDEFGGSKPMPVKPFFLFGMGNRRKLVCRDGALVDVRNGNVLDRWPVRRQTIVPPAYLVELELTNKARVVIREDEEGVWIAEGGSPKLIEGTAPKLVLPTFEAFRFDQALRVLNHEILINIVDGKPLPNFLVYTNPWRRDAAMMAMCLQKTGNLELIRPWVLGLSDPYDHNNQANGIPENEADNLGQTLYLVSLFSDQQHPAVQHVLDEIPKFLITEGPNRYIKGRSDFHFTPVYQTKWLKFGLQCLGLDDPYNLPAVADDYSSLFWWDYKQALAGDEPKSDDYPYLGWARDHFHRKKRNPISNQDYPLSWEINASQADYQRMSVIDGAFVKQRNAMPHSWHAAEVFLYLLEFPCVP